MNTASDVRLFEETLRASSSFQAGSVPAAPDATGPRLEPLFVRGYAASGA